MLELLKEQLTEYADKLGIVEKEIVRKYKAGEDYENDIIEAHGLIMLKAETVKMMAQYIKLLHEGEIK